MAEDRSVGGLYLRLGLSLSELETGFVTAERTVAANISRLNRESDLIRIRSEIEIAGLDETADAERILQIRTETLNRQMAIQRDRVRILTAELQSLTAAHGENSTVAQRAAVRLERERLTLANLERDLRSLNDAQGESNNSFGELNDMLPAMPTKLQAVGIAFGAVTAGIGAAATATKELVEEFRELQNQSYELNMSFPDTREFLREMRLAGGDIGDYEGFIRGITDAYVKGEYDDPEFIALRKYGAEIVDATGRLKDFKDISEEVFQAWEKADAAGEGIEFLQLAGGESGIRDAIQYFQRLREAREDASKIFKTEMDDKQLHKLERTFNLATEQAGEFKTALANLFTPAAQAAGEKFFQLFRDGTEYLTENKDALQKWGFVAAEVFDTAADKWSELTSYSMPDTGDEKVDKLLDRLQWLQSFSNDSALWGDNSPWSKIFLKLPKDLFGDVFERAKKKQQAYNGELIETDKALGEVEEELAALTSEQKENGDVLSQYGIQRVKEFKDELADLEIELEFGDNDYQKSLAELDLWRERELTDKLQVSAGEREAIEKLYAAKSELIERERADKIAEIYKSINNEFRLNYDERAQLIEQEKDKFVAAGMDEAEAYSQAQDTINDKFKTSLDERLADIEDEKQQWISAGMDEAAATALAQRKIAQAYEESNAKVQEHLRNAADIEYELTHTAFEKQLRDIVAWEDAEHRKAETAEEVAAVVKEAAMKEAEAFEREVDRIKNLTQSLEDEIFEMENSQYEVDIRRAKQKAQRALDEGVDYATVQRYLRDKFGQLDKRAAESREKDGDYTKRPEGALGGGYIGLFTDENKIRQQILPRMDEYAQAAVAQIESTKALTAAQQDLTQDFQAVTGDAVLEIPTQELQQFGDAIQQITAPLSESADAQQAVTDSAKKFSPELQRLTESTKSLVEVQNKLAQELSEEKTPLSTDGAQKFKELARKLKENDGALPNATSATKIQDVQVPKAQAGKNLSSELLAPVMDIGKSVQSLQQKESEIKFPDLLAPLTSIDEKFQSLLQEEEPRESDRLQELIGTLPNIEEDVKSILFALQREPEEPTPQDKRETVNVALEIPAAEKTTPAAAIELPSVEPAGEINFAGLVTPLEELNNSAQEILQELQALQSTEETPESADYSSELASLDLNVQSILEELQSRDTTPETVAAEVIDYTVQLTSIDEDIKSIVPALQGKETVAPIDYTSLLTNINENIQAILQEDLRCRIQSAKDCPPLPEISVATEQAAATQIGLSNYSDILTQIRDGVQSLFQHKETQAETNKDYSLQLAAIGEDVQGILAELQRRDETPAPTEMPSTETADYSATLNRISETVQGILQAVQTPQETSGTTLEAPAAIDYSAQLSALPAISGTTQSILQELQQPESRMDFSELVTPLTSLDEKVQGLLQAVQTEEPQETLGMETFVDLPVISANVQSILQELQTAPDTPTAPAAETIDYLTPLVSIDGNLQSVLQHLQSSPEQSTMPDYSATLSDIGGNVQSILRTVQSREKISLTTVVTPLNKIEAAIGNIVNALNNRKPAQITVSPNNSIDLGGAYVFDNALKQQLVNDITKEIVDEITTSVRQAISQSSYGYSA